MSRECPQSVEKVPQTLRGHSRDTFWILRSPGPEGPRRHPVGHSVGHPPFSGTLSGTLPGTLRARRARETPVAGRGVRNSFLRNSTLDTVFRPFPIIGPFSWPWLLLHFLCALVEEVMVAHVALAQQSGFRSLSLRDELKHCFAHSPKTLLWNFSLNLPGNFALKDGGDFWWTVSGLRFPRNEARKLLKNFGENSEQNSGHNSGRKFEKSGELSFCNLSDVMKQWILICPRQSCIFAVLFSVRSC